MWVANLGQQEWGHEGVPGAKTVDNARNPTAPPRRPTPVSSGRGWRSAASTIRPRPRPRPPPRSRPTELPAGFAPRAVARAKLVLFAPSVAGDYLLLLDIVTPEIGSLAAQGVEPTIVRVPTPRAVPRRRALPSPRRRPKRPGRRPGLRQTRISRGPSRASARNFARYAEAPCSSARSRRVRRRAGSREPVALVDRDGRAPAAKPALDRRSAGAVEGLREGEVHRRRTRSGHDARPGPASRTPRIGRSRWSPDQAVEFVDRLDHVQASGPVACEQSVHDLQPEVARHDHRVPASPRS